MKSLIVVFCLLTCGAVFCQTEAINVKADTIFSFKDSRDGKTYMAFEINGVAWMGENLRHKTGDSWCYDNKSSNCQEFGRMYSWDEAKVACPNGWHLPTKPEWDTLVSWLGGDRKAGYPLAFSDSLGFLIKFGYPPNVNGRYSDSDVQASYWTADENSPSTAWVYYFIRQKLPLVYTNYFSKNYGMMCRCVRDAAAVPEGAQIKPKE
ncbi:MAG: FISUMP domain-containing protein [Chitinophagales bacterium]|nr:hypothetical protein [Bacteroidota bacterium]